MTGSMVERVTMATCACEPCICKHLARFEGMPCLDRGRAAIEAMREPTEEMMQAAEKVDDDDVGYRVDLKAAYQTMIDAALAEPK